MKEKPKELLQQLTGQRVVCWMEESGYSCKGLSIKIGENDYSFRTIQSIRQGQRPVTEKFARAIVEIDRKKHPDAPGKTIRKEYLMGEDDFKTIDDAISADCAAKEAESAFKRVSHELAAFEWTLEAAGFTLRHPEEWSEGAYMITSGISGDPLILLSATEIDNLRQELVDYAEYRVKRLLKKNETRKEVTNDGIHAKADD